MSVAIATDETFAASAFNNHCSLKPVSNPSPHHKYIVTR